MLIGLRRKLHNLEVLILSLWDTTHERNRMMKTRDLVWEESLLSLEVEHTFDKLVTYFFHSFICLENHTDNYAR